MTRIILAGLIILFLISCGTDRANNQKADYSKEAAIRFGLLSSPVNLNPLLATDAVSSRINRLLYRTLINFGSDNLPVPGIASWEKLNDRHYRFTLIEQSRFHHGKPLTAYDIMATYEAVLDKKRASPHRNTLEHIQKINVLDNMTVDFLLTRPDPLFPAFLEIGILPEDLLEKNHPFHSRPVGSGAFELYEWQYEDQLILRRRHDNQLIKFLTVKNPTIRVLKLLNGELDLIQNNLPPEHINYLKNQSDIVFLKNSGANYSYLGFNMEDELTGRLEIRKAIAYALDRKKIIQYALGNAATMAEGFFPESHWAGARLKGHEYNSSEALRIMKSLGYSQDNPLKITYKTSSDPFRIRIATIIQNQLKDIFIDINIRSYDWGTFYGDIKQGNFQLYSLTWVGIKTPDIFRYVFHSDSLPPEGANRGRLNDKKLNELIETAAQEQNLESQAELYQKIQKRLNQLLPYVSLWYEDNIAFYRQDIDGYHVAQDGNYDGLLHIHRKMM